MKKRLIIIILSILVVLGIVVITFLKPIKYEIKVRNYEKRLNDYYNLNKKCGFSNVSDSEIDDYLSLTNTEYDVTKFINFYFKQITNKNDRKIDDFHGKATNIYMDAMDLSDFVDKENVNINEVTKELEKTFIHKSEDIYKEWYMSVDIPSNIGAKETDWGYEVDMPLGYYYTYQKSDCKKLYDIKSVRDFKFNEDIDFEKTKFYKCSMILELADGTDKIIEHEIQYNNKTKDFSPYLKNIYYSGNHSATITLGNHDLHDAYDGFWDNLDSY